MRVEGGFPEERALVALSYCDGGRLREQAVARVVGVDREVAAQALRELRELGLAEVDSAGLDWVVWQATARGRRRAWELLRDETCFARRRPGEHLVDVSHSPPRRRYFPSEVEAQAKILETQERAKRRRRRRK